MIAARFGIEAVPVAIDERGIDVDALAATEVRAVILTPTHQFPTGIALASERRQALVGWANEHAARRSSRTTTTPSFAMTVTRSARCRGWLPIGSR